ncbi:MAG: hypothetical protein ACK54P_14905, partial [Bacteroidota bacterium]
VSILHPDILLPLAGHPSDFVLEEFYRTLASRSRPVWDDSFVPPARRSIAAEAEMHKLRFLAGHDPSSNELLALLGNAKDTYDKVAVIRAMVVNQEFMPLLRDEYILPDRPSAIRSGATEALLEMHAAFASREDFIANYVLLFGAPTSRECKQCWLHGLLPIPLKQPAMKHCWNSCRLR